MLRKSKTFSRRLHFAGQTGPTFAGWVVTVAVALVTSATGCRQADSITVYEIPKSRSGLDGIRDAAVAPSAGSASANANAAVPTNEPSRIVVALFEKPDATWFFKISGDPEDVESARSLWEPYINEVTFEDSADGPLPKLRVPEGWKRGKEAPFRYATLEMPDTDLTIAVSRLGGRQDLLTNVNRWRTSQLSLDAATTKTLGDNLKKQTGADGEYLLFDQTGTSAGQSMGGPFMRAQAAAKAAAAANPVTKDGPNSTIVDAEASDSSASAPKAVPPTTAPPSPLFDLTPPDGFTPGKTSPMVVARFLREQDGAKAQISVVPLTAINQWNDNVNFWRQAVGLESMDDEQIASETESVTVSSMEGKRIELIDGETAESQAIIGVMVKKDEFAWFFKLSGNRDLVRESEPAFDQFLQNFEFK